jgi:hypothetical protein
MDLWTNSMQMRPDTKHIWLFGLGEMKTSLY